VLCVGVLARVVVGVLARAVGVPARDVLPFVTGRFDSEGEFGRVEEGLEESAAPLNFLTDKGSFDPDV
jgi:hypothetical protein